MSSLFRSKKSKEKEKEREKDAIVGSKETLPKVDKSSQASDPKNPPSQHSTSDSGSKESRRDIYPWSKHAFGSDNPFPRYGHACNAITHRDLGDIYVFGGLVNNEPRNDVWLINASEMSAQMMSTSGDCPSSRVGHAGLQVGNAFIVFGGDNKSTPYDALDNILYLLNTSSRQWSRAVTYGPRPQGRYGHSLNILGAKVYVFGGQVEGQFFNDLVAFDLNTCLCLGTCFG